MCNMCVSGSGEGGIQIFIINSKGEDSNDHERSGGKKKGAGSNKGSRRKRKGRLIEETLIGKKALSSTALEQIDQ